MDNRRDKIRVIVTEDDLPTQNLIKSYLTSMPAIEIIASYTNGSQLIETIAPLQPTVVFLDIEMPDLDGITTAALLRTKWPQVFIVFITGHTKYAAEAYELEVIDYLVKPISKDRLHRTISKIEGHLALTTKPNGSGDQRITFKNNHEIYFVKPGEIFFIEKEIRKTVIHTENGKYTTTDSLKSILDKLGSNFFRCHKSFLVNIKKIEKISPIAERIYEIYFYNYPLRAAMGRPKMEELCNIMAGLE